MRKLKITREQKRVNVAVFLSARMRIVGKTLLVARLASLSRQSSFTAPIEKRLDGKARFRLAALVTCQKWEGVIRSNEFPQEASLYTDQELIKVGETFREGRVSA